MARKNSSTTKNISVLVVDDDINVTASIRAYLARQGYMADEENDPFAAVEKVRNGNYDIILLDYIMSPVHGDEVVRCVREFDRDISIILVTGHKDMAPPIETLNSLDIQDYYEKNGRLDQLLIRVTSCSKAILQSRTIREYQKGTEAILERMPRLYSCSMENAAEEILRGALELISAEKGRISFTAEGKTYDCGTAGQGGDAIIEETFNDITGTIEGSLVIEAESPKDNERRLLKVYARQAASAIANRCLFKKIEDSLTELEKSYIGTVNGLRNAVEAKDRYTLGHSDRVAAIAAAIAEEMGLSDDTAGKVFLAGTFHDIGKIGVNDSILNKEGKLTDEEYAEIKKHPDKGVAILKAVERFNDILPAVRFHHERIDGKGYPMGLKGSEIPVEARIIAAADCFDAITSRRVYSDGVTVSEAITEMKRVSGTQLDEAVVDALIRISENLCLQT